MKNGLLSGSERRKRSITALRWSELMNFSKLTCRLFRKPFRFFDISSIGFENLVPPELVKPFSNNKVKIVVVT